MSIKAFKQTEDKPKPTVPPAKNEQLEETELQDVSGGAGADRAVLGDGYATCC